MMTTKDPQTNLETVVTTSFDSDPNAASGLQVDYDFNTPSEEDDDAAPAKHSFMFGGRWAWISLAAVLFAAFVMILGGAVGGIAANYQATQAQAAFKVKDSSSSSKSSKSGVGGGKSGKSKSGGGVLNPNADAEEPDFDAVRAKYEGTIKLEGGVDCGSDIESDEYKACVQGFQNSMAAVLEREICVDPNEPLVPPCRVAVQPNPEVEVADRRLNVELLWNYIVYLTISGPSDSDAEALSTIDSASEAILSLAEAIRGLQGGGIEVIVGELEAVFNVLSADLSEDPYEWASIIPNVVGYQLLGKGYCQDSLENYYGAVLYNNPSQSFQSCAAMCEVSATSGCIAENGWTLAGFETEGATDCYCLVNDIVPSCDDPQVTCSCSDNGELDDIEYGDAKGQQWFSDGEDASVRCFRYI